MEGFFLTERIEVAKYVLNFCKDNNKLFVFNISGQYMCRDYPNEMKYFTEQCDILFGNGDEYKALAKVMGHDDNFKSFATYLTRNFSGRGTPKYGKMVIITNGSETVIGAHSGGQVDEIDVFGVRKDEIKDTTGAGDSYVAGFLTALFSDQPPVDCLKWGSWVSLQIIKQVGCTVPDYAPDEIKTIH